MYVRCTYLARKTRQGGAVSCRTAQNRAYSPQVLLRAAAVYSINISSAVSCVRYALLPDDQGNRRHDNPHSNGTLVVFYPWGLGAVRVAFLYE